MKTVLQPGYKVKYRQWSTFKDFEVTIENAVKYKRKNTYAVWPDYIFYNKKGQEVFRIGAAELHFVERIYTTVLEESPRTWITIVSETISNSLKNIKHAFVNNINRK